MNRKRQREDDSADQRNPKRFRADPRSSLAEIQAELQSIEEKCASEQIIKQQEYDTKKKPYLIQRSVALRDIPNFWRSVVEVCHRVVGTAPVYAGPEELEMLDHLIEVHLEDNLDENGSHTFRFEFDAAVKKYFTVDGPGVSAGGNRLGSGGSTQAAQNGSSFAAASSSSSSSSTANGNGTKDSANGTAKSKKDAAENTTAGGTTGGGNSGISRLLGGWLGGDKEKTAGANGGNENIVIERRVKVNDEQVEVISTSPAKFKWTKKIKSKIMDWLFSKLESDDSFGTLFRAYIWENPIQIYEMNESVLF